MCPFNNSLSLRVIGDASDVLNLKLTTKLFKGLGGVPGAIVSFYFLGLPEYREALKDMSNNIFCRFSCVKAGEYETTVSVDGDMSIF